MSVQSKIYQQIEINLLRRSALATVVDRDLAQIGGPHPAKPAIHEDHAFSPLRWNLILEQTLFDTINVAGKSILSPFSGLTHSSQWSANLKVSARSNKEQR